jgi:hypothetical protein
VEVLGQAQRVEPDPASLPDHPVHRNWAKLEVLRDFGVRMGIDPLQPGLLVALSTVIHNA